MVLPEPLQPNPEPTQDVVDLSEQATDSASDLRGAAAVPDELVPESISPEVDLTPELPTEDFREHIGFSLEVLMIVKLKVMMGAKKLGTAVGTATAICVLAVAGALLIATARPYTGPILVGCAAAAGVLLLMAWVGRRDDRQNR